MPLASDHIRSPWSLLNSFQCSRVASIYWYWQGSPLTCIYVLQKLSGFGGLEVACWPLVPKFAGSHPVEAVGFLGRKRILSTPSFGGEVKPSVPCRSFTACKRSLNVTWKSAFRQNLLDISRPQVHLPPLGALAWCHAWRRLVAKVGTSNPDRTISLKRLQCVIKTKHKHTAKVMVGVNRSWMLWSGPNLRKGKNLHCLTLEKRTDI
jgi:hypothetical protein